MFRTSTPWRCFLPLALTAVSLPAGQVHATIMGPGRIAASTTIPRQGRLPSGRRPFSSRMAYAAAVRNRIPTSLGMNGARKAEIKCRMLGSFR
jgi:hypothetical protein